MYSTLYIVQQYHWRDKKKQENETIQIQNLQKKTTFKSLKESTIAAQMSTVYHNNIRPTSILIALSLELYWQRQNKKFQYELKWISIYIYPNF